MHGRRAALNVLITNVGRRGYLVEFFKDTLSPRGKVYASDCDITASGLYGNNDGYFILPRTTDDEEFYMVELLKCCIENEISVVIPLIDPEIYCLSAHREQFLSRGINVIVSERPVLEICYNKIAMNEFLNRNNFFHPSTFDSIQSFEDAYREGLIAFPVIIKPIYGSGSLDTYVVDSDQKLQALFRDGLIIQEFLTGEEYGVDVFNTFDKKPVRCVVKKKIAMRSGETDKAVTVKNELIQQTVIEIAKKLGHIGNLDCDLIIANEKIYIIDLNPRFGGGYIATHVAGVNLPELIIKMIEGEPVSEDFSGYKENLLVMKTIGAQVTSIGGSFLNGKNFNNRGGGRQS